MALCYGLAMSATGAGRSTGGGGVGWLVRPGDADRGGGRATARAARLPGQFPSCL